MPAAAVIPAPAAYIDIAAVKKLVVEMSDAGERSIVWSFRSYRGQAQRMPSPALNRVGAALLHLHLEESEPLKGSSAPEQQSMV